MLADALGGALSPILIAAIAFHSGIARQGGNMGDFDEAVMREVRFCAVLVLGSSPPQWDAEQEASAAPGRRLKL